MHRFTPSNRSERMTHRLAAHDNELRFSRTTQIADDDGPIANHDALPPKMRSLSRRGASGFTCGTRSAPHCFDTVHDIGAMFVDERPMIRRSQLKTFHLK